MALAYAQQTDSSYIFVSKPERRLYIVSAGDSILFHCRIACGANFGNKKAKGDQRTPEGVCTIIGIFNSTDWVYEKEGKRYPKVYGPWFFRLRNPEGWQIGIHGTNKPSSIGKRCSDGCIRVRNENAQILRRYIYKGMRCIVSGEKELTPPLKYEYVEGFVET